MHLRDSPSTHLVRRGVTTSAHRRRFLTGLKRRNSWKPWEKKSTRLIDPVCYYHYTSFDADNHKFCNFLSTLGKFLFWKYLICKLKYSYAIELDGNEIRNISISFTKYTSKYKLKAYRAVARYSPNSFTNTTLICVEFFFLYSSSLLLNSSPFPHARSAIPPALLATILRLRLYTLIIASLLSCSIHWLTRGPMNWNTFFYRFLIFLLFSIPSLSGGRRAQDLLISGSLY